MKTKKSKLLSTVLAAVMIASVGTVMVSAAPDAPTPIVVSNNQLADTYYSYLENDDGTITLTGFASREIQDYVFKNMDILVFPDTIDGKTVTKIGNYRQITQDWSAEYYPFDDSYNEYDHSYSLVKYKLPKTLKEIGERVLTDCSFTEDALPEGLERIDNYSFQSSHFDKIVTPSTLRYIGDGAFYASSGCNDIVLNEGLEYIGDHAFWGWCFGAKNPTKEITIPKSVKKIGYCAFEYNVSINPTTILSSQNSWRTGLQMDITFNIYSGGYVEQYMKYCRPYSGADMYSDVPGYKYKVIGQVDPVPSQKEKDYNISISGAIPEGAEFKAVATTTKWLENPFFCYELTLNKNGETVQPDGFITISIPCEYSNGSVYWINEETGEKENLHAVYANGKYVFAIDHLSEFSITFDGEPVKYDGPIDEDPEENSETGENSESSQTGQTSQNSTNNTTNNNTTTNTPVNTTVTAATTTTETDTSVPKTGDASASAVVLSVMLAASAAAIIFAKRRKSN